MTLFFLILLTVSLSIFGFQRLQRRQKKPIIKPSLPKIEEPVSNSRPEQPILPELPTEPKPLSALPIEEKPILLSPKDPEPPANLPIE